MSKPNKKRISAHQIRKFLSPDSDTDVFRIYYCYQIGSTFIGLSMMESTIITAMTMCDKIKVTKVLGDDTKAWKHIIERQSHLQNSTLGNLIGILSKHEIGGRDLDYLKWVKEKRDFFIHRYFRSEAWPGDLSTDDVRILSRQLLYLDLTFHRAANKIYKIFARAGLVEYYDLGGDGALVANVGSFAGEDAWLQDFAISAIRDRAARARKLKK